MELGETIRRRTPSPPNSLGTTLGLLGIVAIAGNKRAIAKHALQAVEVSLYYFPEERELRETG